MPTDFLRLFVAQAGSGNSVPMASEFGNLLQGWMGPHWMARRMSAALQQNTSSAASIDHSTPNHEIDLGTAIVQVRGGRTLAAASDIFSDEAPDRAREMVSWKTASVREQGFAAAKATTGSEGMIEEATTDLLRPLLRQWVDDHMSSVVLKALSSDLSDSGQTR